jgi:phosphatidylethanolamine-binding protein (PEBP) family uncharacterized protein
MTRAIALFAAFCLLWACSEKPADLPVIAVDFSWPEHQKCFDERSPEIRVDGVPESARRLQIQMRDLDNRYDHGGGSVPWEGAATIPEGTLDKYRGPCPSYGSPRYQITVKALDETGVAVALGRKTRRYPPEAE